MKDIRILVRDKSLRVLSGMKDKDDVCVENLYLIEVCEESVC